jgi:hypothetical protein
MIINLVIQEAMHPKEVKSPKYLRILDFEKL